MTWENHPASVHARKRAVARFRARRLYIHPRPVIFICGKQGFGNRHLLREYLNRHRPELLIFFAEPIWDALNLRPAESYGHSTKSSKPNALKLEQQLAGLANVVIVIAESPGTFAELGAFAASGDLRKKLLAVVERKYRGEASFLMGGPVRWVEEDSGFGAVFADFLTFLTCADEISAKIVIPRFGPLRLGERIVPTNPRHVLFMVCDLVTVIGPTPLGEVAAFIVEILGVKENLLSISIESTLELLVALELIEASNHKVFGRLYSRNWNGRRPEAFQRALHFDLVEERARYLSDRRRIPAAWRALVEVHGV